MKSKIIGMTILGLSLVAGKAAVASSRMTKKLGFSVGVISDPFPSFISYQVKFNATPWLQVEGAYGTAGKTVKSYGGSAKVFLLPSWNLSPYIGGGYTMAKLSGAFTLSSKTVNLAQKSMNVYYASAGIDNQSNIGFNFGGGINYALAPKVLTAQIKLLPQVYVGWVF